MPRQHIPTGNRASDKKCTGQPIAVNASAAAARSGWRRHSDEATKDNRGEKSLRQSDRRS